MDENVDVLHSLMALREEAWHVDMALHKYQDQKGILIDVLFDQNLNSKQGMSIDSDGSEEAYTPALRSHAPRPSRSQAYHGCSRHRVSMEHAHQIAENVYQEDSAGSRRWYHKITRASLVTAVKHHAIARSRSSMLEPHAMPSTLSIAAAAVAESFHSLSPQTSADGRHEAYAPCMDFQGLDSGADPRSSDIERWVKSLTVMDSVPDVWEHQEVACPHASPRRVNFELISQLGSTQLDQVDAIDGSNTERDEGATKLPRGPLPKLKSDLNGHSASVCLTHPTQQ